MSAAIVGGNLVVPAAVRAADPLPVIVGNATVERTYATDFAAPNGTLGPVLVVIQASPLPEGTLTEFRTWNQATTGLSPTPSAGSKFIAYVLRPAAASNAYHVIYRSVLHTVPALVNPLGNVATFAAGNVAVETGDLLAFYGQGIPLDVGLGSDTLSYEAPTPPVNGTTITLGASPYPIFSQDRNYSFGASVTPAPFPIGQGFTLNASDIRFIQQQIRIAEAHVVSATAANPCGTLLGSGPNQVSSPTLPFGLRSVDGTCNNLQPGQSEFGAADRKFPRLLTPVFRSAQNVPPGFGPSSGSATSYTQLSGTVFDSQPRTISNLIVDQTGANPAAVAAAGEGAVPDSTGTLFIPNRAPDVGLSAPYNSWFTLFGQFFDHGLDLVAKGGNGSVFMPLQPDDPLYNPAAGSPNFMLLTRATVDANHESTNITTPFVDQNQTYTSHPSHQVFLREYANNPPSPTGELIDGAIAGNIGNWAEVKTQAANMLGIALTDIDVLNGPMLATDPYGRFIPGPNGFPQVVFPGNVLTEGNLAAPISVTGSVKTGHAFLDDIAHNAAPSATKVADADSLVSTAGQAQPAGTYDDELLDVHFVTGDGRGNENIGLTSVHTVFHSEHNRLVADIDRIINAELTPAEIAEWHAIAAAPPAGSGWDYGERLFQAARFVTEMQYQHLVFEEFGRRVQPQINLFAGYQTEINPAISAEFAHTVYRFGHSMLNQTIDRTDRTGLIVPAPVDIDLFDAFLNPVAFNDVDGNPSTPPVGAAMAAGSVVQGMSRQVGNELDEFVTDALRNRLVGLPLDLTAINMARGRSEGIPGLNAARRGFYATTSDAALAPYESWADFAFNLKHSESAANFIAAYGTHTHITTLDPDGTGPIVAGSIAARRAAVDQIINGTTLPGPDGVAGDNPLTVCEALNNPVGCDESADDITAPADSLDFLTGAGTWANVAGLPVTGLEGIDFWVGGLAEKQAPFGGLLGTTFNYVFETQMENLQDGDRFYYLARTAGLNMLVQLEGNSFSELIMRNTTARALPAEVFARPDFSFTVGKLGTSGPILDDAATPWNESALLTRNSPTAGTIRFAGGEHVIWYGTANADRVYSSEGDDTIRLNNGNDWAEGGAGNDQFIGGDGDDILNDNFGDDVLKGGPGDDAMSSGQGFDLNQGGTGNDFIVGGSDPTETFGGPGNDMIIAGQSSDTVFGDDGDDWIEGGAQADLLQGDNGAPFQNDPNAPGHDVIIGDGGNDDYDSEGGDDIMVAGPGIERNEGMLGFDWAISRGDPQAADVDLFFTGLLPPDLDAIRDRFDLVEGVSGWNLNDTLRGSNDDALTLGTDHQLTTAGIARISGLAAILPAGATSFNAGNIILGGAGSDLIEGRGGDDIIDGDRWLNVQLSDGTQAFDNMSAFRARVFAGTLDPGSISIVRSIVATGALASNVDTAVYSGPFAEYELTFNANGSVTVDHTGAPVAARSDGRDTLRNVEQLSFCDAPGIDPGSCDVPRTIIALAPIANASPASPGALAFGDVTSGTTSPTQAIVIGNGGIAPLTVSSATKGGANPGSFVVTNGCAIVAPAGSCTINVAFAPPLTPLGAASATLTIVHNAAGSPLTYSLTGTGVLFINTPASGTVTIDDTTPAEDQLLTASGALIVDPDGIGPITFTWQAETALAIWSTVGTGATFTPGDAQVGQALRVVATYTDGALVPVAESVTSAATTAVANVNDVPVGTPVLADALQAVWPQESTAITAGTAGITDADGLGAFSYQWQQRGGGAFANIAGATASTFVPSQAQVSQRLRVVVTYTDGRGTLETLNSAETTNVVGDVFTGTVNADTFAGTAGRDNVSGLGGADNLSGGLGPDTINGGGGADAISSGDGDDIVIGNGGDDTINTGAGNDVIRVGPSDGFDAVTGGAGTDRIEATANGTVIGLSSLATVESITANGFTGVTIVGSAAANTLNFAAVTLTGIVSIDGANGADAITGSNLPDVLLGGAGADTVAGGGGDDTITGGAGNDALNGNAGLDTFVFAATFGADTITGFDANPGGTGNAAGQDKLDIRPLGITAATFAANVGFSASGGGTNTVVTIVGGGTITILGVPFPGTVANQITIADFIVAP